MRVPVSSSRRLRRDGERGAVAVVVALLSVVVIGIGAFTVDFGLAYADTRQLQTSADAGALAAANVFKRTPGACAAVVTNGGSAAQLAARNIRAENRPSSTEAAYSTACLADGSLEVTHASQGATPTFLGGLLGRSSSYDKTRTAKARVSVLSEATGIIRPYAVCGSQLVGKPAGQVIRMELPNAGNAACPGAASSGNWWSVDCPEAGSNSNAYMYQATRYGCTDPITVVANQVPAPPAAPRTASGLRTHLESSCPSRSPSCLSANTGAINGVVLGAWDYLVDNHVNIVLPVFCGGTPTGPCDTAAVVNAGGNNAVYPVQALIGVQVCGYHFGNKSNPDDGLPTGECAAHNPSAFTTSYGNNQSNYILFRTVDIPALTQGGSAACPLGSVCDLQRVTYLTQ